MYIKNDFDFNDLMENCWSGAVDTLKTIEEHNKEDELMELLESIMGEDVGEIPTMTEVNDYLWFDSDFIFEALEIEEEEEEEEEIDFSLYDTFENFCDGFYHCVSCPFYKKQKIVRNFLKKQKTSNHKPQKPKSRGVKISALPFQIHFEKHLTIK